MRNLGRRGVGRGAGGLQQAGQLPRPPLAGQAQEGESTLGAHHCASLSRLSDNHVTSLGAQALLQALERNNTILEVW